MFDISFGEMFVVGVVALIVVGPTGLPKMFRAAGEFTGKARRMAREFQGAMNDAARESGVDDISSDLRKMANPKKFGVDKLKEATGDLTSWSVDEADGKPPAADAGLTPDRAAAKAKIDAAYAAKAEAKAASEAAELSGEPEIEPAASETKA